MSVGYESWFLKASHPSQPRGVWIRYTTHRRPGGPETPSLWCTLFGPEPVAAKVTLGAGTLSRGDGTFIRIGDAVFADGRVKGSALGARWDLNFASSEPELRPLPKWTYGAPLPRTKFRSPFPAARFSGSLTFGERTVKLAGWPGTVGHNWGSAHAERWVWLHGSTFEGYGDDTWLNVAIGRIRLGRWTTSWLASGALSLRGVRHRLGGFGKRGAEIDEQPDRCRFILPGSDVTVRGDVSAPREYFVGWIYSDPNGSRHHTLNCTIASMRLVIGSDELRTSHGAAYELGVRETDHGIPIQPFPDG